jgi:hypothetical protein
LGAATAGLATIVWGLTATVDLVLWCDVVFTGHVDVSMFPAFVLMVPPTGVLAVAVEELSRRLSVPAVKAPVYRNVVIIGTVNACWVFVVVVLVFRWVA